MPRRDDIKSILLIGSGPIVIGQACEFDYSGTQAIKALKEEGYRVILVNSNPATIMTDPEFADRTYIEPITCEFVEKIIEKERPDALLPTMGGQTALNVALELSENGVLERFGCELIGASVESIKRAEDRELFREAMDEIGLKSAKSGIVRTVKEAQELAEKIGYPMILRPSRTLGGTGGGIVNNPSELKTAVAHALSASPNHEVLIEQSLIGWKEFELEVMRDRKDNVVVVCTIENLDPMGVHTGDSVTVAPIMTLTDKEYQLLRDASIAIMRKIGVDTGGSNVQFAVNPDDGRIIVIEMNPRVSRSSALASKATGFPIAKIAAKLAIGYTLDEIPNDITRETPACFEPSIDYVVVKVPRFNFEKFPMARPVLGTQMKSVGEVMSFGRNFREALQKALNSLEMDTAGFDFESEVKDLGSGELLERCRVPGPRRLWFVAEALRLGHPVELLYEVTGIDRWFLGEIEAIVVEEERIRGKKLEEIHSEELRDLKRSGFSDQRIAALTLSTEEEVFNRRQALDIRPVYRAVDTCAAEFVAYTPYLYSAYDCSTEAPPSNRRKIIILGSGPNRIGQGIEFDYCCVHAVLAVRQDGYEAIMLNCNPETVSTDYDISDRLYFEPLTLEHVLEVCKREQPDGVIVQFGGQTPLKLAKKLTEMGVPIIGTPVDAIDCAEDRERFSELVSRLGLRQPEFATALSLDDALKAAARIGYPLMIRPSFVLGGRAMRVVYSEDELREYIAESVDVSNERPVLLDRFLANAIEVDVDAVSDGKNVVIAGVMEHIERAGVHSGDSSCCIPPQSLTREVVDEMKHQTEMLAGALGVVGLMNVQFAVSQEEQIYILEVNPRASRTVPFVSKATGVPWAKVAARVMAGKSLQELSIPQEVTPEHISVKACVFPFNKFPGVDTILGPEMKSTGEVMGIGREFGRSFARAQFASYVSLPTGGTVFMSVMDNDKPEALKLAEKIVSLGFKLVATRGTAKYLKERGFDVETVNKVREGSPHVVDALGSGTIDMLINTPEGSGPHLDSRSIRLVANELKIPTFTTIAAAGAALEAIAIMQSSRETVVTSLQEYHGQVKG
ncbi:MAG: carbamoyl-phosphate synthase large subunit [Candidatus Dadabacteria bacterium]|nr:MAG: carbamoyl-phosphate synthase large subunit [Candidatus Dadabacteria bacterium]